MTTPTEYHLVTVDWKDATYNPDTKNVEVDFSKIATTAYPREITLIGAGDNLEFVLEKAVVDKITWNITGIQYKAREEKPESFVPGCKLIVWLEC